MSNPNNQHLFADTYYVRQHPTDVADRESLRYPRTEGDEEAEKNSTRDLAILEEASRLKAAAVEVEKQRRLWRALDPKERRSRRIEEAIATQEMPPAPAPEGWDRARFQADVIAKGHKGIGSKMIEFANEEPPVYDPNGVYDQDNRPEEENAIDEVPWIGRQAS